MIFIVNYIEFNGWENIDNIDENSISKELKEFIDYIEKETKEKIAYIGIRRKEKSNKIVNCRNIKIIHRRWAKN